MFSFYTLFCTFEEFVLFPLYSYEYHLLHCFHCSENTGANHLNPLLHLVRSAASEQLIELQKHIAHII